MYIHIYTYIHIYIYNSLYIYIYAYTHVHMYTHTCVCTRYYDIVYYSISYHMLITLYYTRQDRLAPLRPVHKQRLCRVVRRCCSNIHGFVFAKQQLKVGSVGGGFVIFLGFPYITTWTSSEDTLFVWDHTGHPPPHSEHLLQFMKSLFAMKYCIIRHFECRPCLKVGMWVSCVVPGYCLGRALVGVFLNGGVS